MLAPQPLLLRRNCGAKRRAFLRRVSRRSRFAVRRKRVGVIEGRRRNCHDIGPPIGTVDERRFALAAETSSVVFRRTMLVARARRIRKRCREERRFMPPNVRPTHGGRIRIGRAYAPPRDSGARRRSNHLRQTPLELVDPLWNVARSAIGADVAMQPRCPRDAAVRNAHRLRIGRLTRSSRICPCCAMSEASTFAESSGQYFRSSCRYG